MNENASEGGYEISSQTTYDSPRKIECVVIKKASCKYKYIFLFCVFVFYFVLNKLNLWIVMYPILKLNFSGCELCFLILSHYNKVLVHA